MAGDGDQSVVELRPRVVLGPDIHRVVVVQEMEREGDHSPRPLVIEVHRRRATKG